MSSRNLKFFLPKKGLYRYIMTLHKQHNNNTTFLIVYSLHCASFPLQVDLTRALFISFLSSKCFYIYLLPLSRIFQNIFFMSSFSFFSQNQMFFIHKSHFCIFQTSKTLNEIKYNITCSKIFSSKLCVNRCNEELLLFLKAIKSNVVTCYLSNILLSSKIKSFLVSIQNENQWKRSDCIVFLACTLH